MIYCEQSQFPLGIIRKFKLNDSFLIKITSIRKLQLIGLTVVNQIASDSFVAKDHV